jgi:GcrA cell cycle regulator
MFSNQLSPAASPNPAAGASFLRMGAKGMSELRVCESPDCTNEVKRRDRLYCSPRCRSVGCSKNYVRPPSNDWSDADTNMLRELWDEGHSTAEIGRRMGRPKNGICGKTRRLNLPPRPSPIHRNSTAAPRVRVERRRLPGTTSLPKLSSLVAAPVRQEPPAAPKPVEKPPQRAPETVVAPSPFKTCQWITSDGRPWIFCADGVDPANGIYCEKHAKMSRSHARTPGDAA